MPRRSIGFEVGSGNEQQLRVIEDKVDKLVDLVTSLSEESEKTQTKLQNLDNFTQARLENLDKAVQSTQSKVESNADKTTSKLKSMHDAMVCRSTNLNKRVDNVIARIQEAASKVDLGFASLQHPQVAASPVSEPVRNPVPNGIATKKDTPAGQNRDVSSPTISQGAPLSAYGKHKAKVTRTIPSESTRTESNRGERNPQPISNSHDAFVEAETLEEGSGMNGLDPPAPPQPQDVPMPDVVQVTNATPVHKVPQLSQNDGGAIHSAANGVMTSSESGPVPVEPSTSNGIVPSNAQDSGENGSVNPSPLSVDSGADEEDVEFFFEGDNDDPVGDAASDEMEQENNPPGGESSALAQDQGAQDGAVPNGNPGPNQLNDGNMDIDFNLQIPGQDQAGARSGIAPLAQPGNVEAKPEAALLPSDDDLGILPNSPMDRGDDPQVPPGVQLPYSNGQQQNGVPQDPFANHAALNVFPDPDFDEEELDSSAVSQPPPPSPTRTTPMKRKRPASARDESVISEDESEEGSIVVAPRRKKTPTRSPKARKGTPTRNQAPAITEVEAAELVRQADEMRKLFFTEENAACPTQVREMYIRAANSNNAHAMARLVELWLSGAETVHPNGKRLEPSAARAKFWLNKLKNHENSDLFQDKILILEGDLLVHGKPKKKDSELALKKYEQAYNSGYGDVDGIAKIGARYYDMSNRATTDNKAKEYLLKSAKALLKAHELEHGNAAALLGSIYENSSGSEVNFEVIEELEGSQLTTTEREDKAKIYFFDSYKWDSAAGHNDCGACFEVSYADIEYNFDMAAETYRRAFELGFAASAANLGMLYETGGPDGSRQDADEAVKWFELGHRVRCPNATYHLGVVYDYGNFRDRDVKKAIKLYEQAMKLADARSDANDVYDSAKQELEILLVACVLCEEDNHEEAFHKLSNRRRLKLIDECRRQTQWIVAAELKPDEYKEMPSAKQAPKKLDKLLGEHSGKYVIDHIVGLGEDMANASGQELEEICRKLRIFVNDPAMERDLGIAVNATVNHPVVHEL